MTIAKYPSKLSLPQVNPGVTTVLAYLIATFPEIGAAVWQQRAVDGKLHWHDGRLINAQSTYKPQQRVYYYREVADEPVIPFAEQILFQDAHLLVAYKPHFLQVTPGGRYVNECLQNRLRSSTGIDNLQALHRLDRVTAGLVLFSINPETRHCYHRLFEAGQIEKTYQAIARVGAGAGLGAEVPLSGQQWQVSNRIEHASPRFLMRVVEGKANSNSLIRCLQHSDDQALFELQPHTGKTHQLRLHMQTLGWPILHDRYYPTLQPQHADDYAKPLQLLAQQLRFIDPLTGLAREFHSDTELMLE
ncbi:MAG: pseudouridine synthase [Motiliproteus sp.]